MVLPLWKTEVWSRPWPRAVFGADTRYRVVKNPVTSVLPDRHAFFIHMIFECDNQTLVTKICNGGRIFYCQKWHQRSETEDFTWNGIIINYCIINDCFLHCVILNQKVSILTDINYICWYRYISDRPTSACPDIGQVLIWSLMWKLQPLGLILYVTTTCLCLQRFFRLTTLVAELMLSRGSSCLSKDLGY